MRAPALECSRGRPADRRAGPVRAPRARADRRAARAAGAVPPGPEGRCTNVLWTLAGLAGLPPDRFDRSPLPEVSPALTVHDMNLWPASSGLPLRRGGPRTAPGARRLAALLARARSGARLWSGWQSKLLLREPRFLEGFGDAPWFPRVPGPPARSSTTSARSSPRSGAVRARTSTGRSSTTWSPSSRSPTSGASSGSGHARAARAHVGGRRAGRRRHENRSPLPLPPGLYDAPSPRCSRERHGPTTPPSATSRRAAGPAAPAAWAAEVEPLLPLLRATIDEHARLGQLHRVAQRRTGRVQAPSSGSRPFARQAGGARSPAITNREGHTDFNVRWAWADGAPRRGFTAVCGSRDEADNSRGLLPPLLGAVARVVLLDNGSGDGSAASARRSRAGPGRRSASRSATTRSRSPAAAANTSRTPPDLRPQPDLLLQLVVRPRPYRLRAQVGRRHGPHRRRRGRAARPRLAARGRD